MCKRSATEGFPLLSVHREGGSAIRMEVDGGHSWEKGIVWWETRAISWVIFFSFWSGWQSHEQSSICENPWISTLDLHSLHDCYTPIKTSFQMHISCSPEFHFRIYPVDILTWNKDTCGSCCSLYFYSMFSIANNQKQFNMHQFK